MSVQESGSGKLVGALVSGLAVLRYLQRVNGPGTARDVVRLARDVPHDAKSAKVDLSGHRGNGYRIILRKDGDPETGGQSEPFDLE